MAVPVKSLIVGLLAVIVAISYAPVKTRLDQFGFTRTPKNTHIADNDNFVTIQDTIQCEDLHYYQPGNVLFAACEDDLVQRSSWFPGLVNLKPTPETQQGSIHVIDPVSMISRRLAFENFPGPFVTHGIEVIPDSDSSKHVYIFAVNHLPNPEYLAGDKSAAEARSQIELFHYNLGADSVRHVRTIRHPLISTPNDIYAESPTSFYVTNDHFYRKGLLRELEDLFPAAKWSSTMHVSLSSPSPSSPSDGITVTTALSRVHNNNGLGHGRNSSEVLIASAAGGVLHLAARSPGTNNHALAIRETILMPSTLDNPSYYSDAYATPDSDASGYVLAGLARACDLAKTKEDPEATDPVLVWHVRKRSAPNGGEEWEKRIIFEDDGSRIRSASAAVLVGIDPESEGGRKRAWLFVTGFLAKSMVAVKVDL